jgi:hypothetical protein
VARKRTDGGDRPREVCRLADAGHAEQDEAVWPLLRAWERPTSGRGGLAPNLATVRHRR